MKSCNYDALSIARYIVNYSWEIGKPVNNIRLQKILYFVQGAFIKMFDKLCFRDDFECWDYGPSIPNVYASFRQYSMSIIYKINKISVFDFENGKIVDKPVDFSFLQEEDKKLIENIVQESTKFTTSQLVSISQHQTPWLTAKEKGTKTINKKNIIQYFTDKGEKYD